MAVRMLAMTVASPIAVSIISMEKETFDPLHVEVGLDSASVVKVRCRSFPWPLFSGRK
jgi:hypothetical protein